MSAIEVSAELLKETKNFLDITWEDEETDSKLEGQIRRGIAYIADKTGVEKSAPAFQGNTGNDRAQELLFNYVLYDRSGSLDDFKKKYKSDIVGLRIALEVKRKRETSTASGSIS